MVALRSVSSCSKFMAYSPWFGDQDISRFFGRQLYFFRFNPSDSVYRCQIVMDIYGILTIICGIKKKHARRWHNRCGDELGHVEIHRFFCLVSIWTIFLSELVVHALTHARDPWFKHTFNGPTPIARKRTGSQAPESRARYVRSSGHHASTKATPWRTGVSDEVRKTPLNLLP